VQFHFLSRLVSVFLDETFLPGGARVQQLMRRTAAVAFKRNVRTPRRAGLAARRLRARPLPPDLAWAAASAPVAIAFAALAACLNASRPLPDAARDTVQHAVQAWQGEPLPISSSWTTEHTGRLPDYLRPATRLALLTALAPYQVTADDVSTARPLLPDDGALVSALAWAAWTAARRIGGWITRPAEGAVVTH
jgi:hypothetical protein